MFPRRSKCPINLKVRGWITNFFLWRQNDCFNNADNSSNGKIESKSKIKQIVSGISPTQQCKLFIYFYLDNMFRPNDHHQVVFTILIKRCMWCELHYCNMASHKTYKLY
jgi:hypothetical protein